MARRAKTVIFLHPTLSVYNDLHWAHLFLWLDSVSCLCQSKHFVSHRFDKNPSFGILVARGSKNKLALCGTRLCSLLVLLNGKKKKNNALSLCSLLNHLLFFLAVDWQIVGYSLSAFVPRSRSACSQLLCPHIFPSPHMLLSSLLLSDWFLDLATPHLR